MKLNKYNILGSKHVTLFVTETKNIAWMLKVD